MSLARVIGLVHLIAMTAIGCAGGKHDKHDCLESPGYCAFNEYCDSNTRHCELTCNDNPPRPCPEHSSCDEATGACRPLCSFTPEPSETSCADRIDNNCDGRVDCADPECEMLPCAEGCQCIDGRRRELSCGDAIDNNVDGRSDCADEDCDARSCGPGCVCGNGFRRETACDDHIDNDGDGSADCADSRDCPAGVICHSAPAGICQSDRTCGP